MACWVCQCHGEEVATRMEGFIVKNCGAMDLHCIAQQVSDFILLQHLDAIGASEPEVYSHILTHVLHPRVRLSVILRELLNLSTMLQTSIMVNDGANVTVDKTNAELYLKVVNNIVSLYKSDTQGMMFTQDDTLSGS